MGLADIPAVSFEDDLTGLYNRRFLQRYLSTQVDWSGAGPVSFILIDIDAFHQANDQYGHAEGDFVLQTFGERLKKVFRPDDVVARDGGDSFFIVLPGLAKDAAVPLATAVVEGLKRDPIRTRRDRFPVELTASAGVVAFPDDGHNAEAIRDAADKVLFHAKREGRNRVSVGGKINEMLAAERDVFAGLPCQTFCGRKAEFQAAQAVVEELHAGRPSVLFIQGPAGIGKSRFLREIAGVATTRDLLYLYVICNESQRQSAGYALLYLVDQYYRLNPQAQQDLHECLFPAQRRVARELIPSLASWREEDVEISPRDRKPLVLGMLETAVLAMARRSPLLILLDNARHCDRGTLDVLQRILRDRRAPIAVFFSVKGDVRHIDPKIDIGLHEFVEELQRTGSMQVLTLLPLKREDLSAMLQSILANTTIPREFEELICEKSGGNPLYVEEAIRGLLLRGRIAREGDRYVLRGVTEQELPASLDGAIEQVLATLSPEAGELVTNASIIGSRFDIQVLQEVMGKREGETLDAVDQVENTKLIEHLERGTGDDFAFRSSTAQEVRYVRTGDDARKVMHRRLSSIARARSLNAPQRGLAERHYHLAAAGLPIPAEEREEPSEEARPAPAFAPAAPSTVGRQPRIPEASAALPPTAVSRAIEFMRSLAALLRIGRLYPQWSQTSAQFTRQLHEAATALLQEAPAATFAADAHGVLLNGHPQESGRAGEVQSDFGTLLADRLVATMTMAQGLEDSELDALVAALAAPMNRSRTAPDHWDQFLDRERIKHIDILQRRYVAREGEQGTRVIKRAAFVERALTGEELDELRDALRHFKAASDNLRLYPPGHALVEEAMGQAVRSMVSVVGRVQILALAATEDGLLVNSHPTDTRTIGDGGAFLSAQLKKRELNVLTLTQGLRADEVQGLISVFAVPPEDPAWKDVLKAVVTGNEIRNMEFGGLLYSQLAAAAGGVVPAGVVSSRPAPTPAPGRSETAALRERAPRPAARTGLTPMPSPAHGAAAPAPATDAGAAEAEEEEDEVAEAPGMAVRADVRARAYLKAPPDRFLSDQFERELGPLLEVLNFGWTVQLGTQLVGRLAELGRDPNAAFRRRAMQIMARGLLETSSPEARGPMVTKAGEVLAVLVTGEIEPTVLVQAAETIPAWIGAAFDLGRFDAAADLLLRVRKRIDSKTAPPEFKSKISEKLQELAGPKGPVVAALRTAAPSMREAALKIGGMFGPTLVPVLVEIVIENDDVSQRRLAAQALKEIGGGGAAELTKLVARDGPAEKIVRALSVLELAGIGALAGPVLAAVDHEDAGVRAAAFAMLKRAEKPLAVGALKKLVASERSEIVMATIALAGEMGLPDLGLEITRIAQSSHNEAVVRACCDYLVHVKTPSAIPALWRIFESRAKMFGLVKGFSDGTRALAVKAAAGLTHQEAAELVEEARHDKSPEVRKAAGA